MNALRHPLPNPPPRAGEGETAFPRPSSWGGLEWMPVCSNI